MKFVLYSYITATNTFLRCLSKHLTDFMILLEIQVTKKLTKTS